MSGMDGLHGCFDCRYHHEYSTDQGENVMCRRFPPVAIMDGDGESMWQSWSFPNVWKYCWCGEWSE